LRTFLRSLRLLRALRRMKTTYALCRVYTYSLCLTEFGILLVAVSCPQAQGGNFRVNPGNSLILQQGHVGFFIAQGPNKVRK